MNENTKEAAKKGITVTFGSCLAMVISYANWHSVEWAIVHGLMTERRDIPISSKVRRTFDEAKVRVSF